MRGHRYPALVTALQITGCEVKSFSPFAVIGRLEAIQFILLQRNGDNRSDQINSISFPQQKGNVE